MAVILAEHHRRLAATRKRDHGELVNDLLQIGGTIKGSSSKALFNFAPRELLSITQAKFLCKRLFRVLLKSFPKLRKTITGLFNAASDGRQTGGEWVSL